MLLTSITFCTYHHHDYNYMPARTTRSTRTKVASKTASGAAIPKTTASLSDASEDEKAWDSEDLDNDDTPKKSSQKRKRPSQSQPKLKSGVSTSRKRRKSPEEDEEEDEGDFQDNVSLDSDALDDDPPAKSPKQRGKPKSKSTSSPKKSSPKKRRKVAKEDDDDDEISLELEDGQEVVGRVVQAPKTGRGLSRYKELPIYQS